ncbi:ankyrin repeat-containing domain protein [Mycena capillaripes]|nr:ankyrin repeat-containing domain protein [Mycena capillaripes]
MADIVGLIASILQLVDGVVKARIYVQDFRNAPKDQQQLLQEIKGLDPFIRKLDERIRSSHATALTRNLETPLIQLKEMIERLTKKLSLEGIQKSSGRLTWSLWGREDVQDGLNTIERFKSLVNVWLGVDISDSAEEIASALSDIAEEQRIDHGYVIRSLNSSGREQKDYHERTISLVENVTEEQRINHNYLSKSVMNVGKSQGHYHDRTISFLQNVTEEQQINHNYLSKSVRDIGKNQDHYHTSAERDQIIEWYSPLNMFLRQADIFSLWQPGTGRWLLEHDAFERWKSGTGRTLWCRGMPGAGKTVLTSLITDTLRAETESQNIGVGVIYLNHKETEHSPSGLLAAVWRQLVFTKPLPPIMEQLYRKHREPRTRPTIDEHRAVLRSTISEYSKVFILVDGLDEYPEKQREILLRHLGALGPVVNLLLTSRSHITISHIISNHETLEIRATQDDIRRYLHGQILRSSRLSKHVANSPNLHQELEARVVERSDGMFLLAKLHLDSLTEKRTVKEVRDALNNMADDLDIAYDAVVDRIDQQSQGDKKLAWRTLSWIIHAERPLRRAELREALAVEPGATNLDAENLPDMDIVLSVCTGLVVVNEEDDKVRLIHYTAELYLQSEHVKARIFPQAQSDITMTCITYLSVGFEAIGHMLQGPMFLFTHSPFLHYAVDNCLVHARGEPESQIRHSILSFLAECSVWWRLWKWKIGCEFPANKLWIAAFFCLEETCRSMIQEDGRSFVVAFQEAISMMSTGGVTKVVSVLTDILRTTDKFPSTSLPDFCSNIPPPLSGGQSASAFRFPWPVDVFMILFQNGAVQPGQCIGPLLQQAASQGATDMVQTLLQNGVDLQENGSIALQEASAYGYNEIISLLMDHNVDVNERGRDGTALQIAAFFGHVKSVRILVDGGAQIDSEGGRYGTALCAASKHGYERVVRLLIGRGADINAKGEDALRLASENGHTEIVKLLIEGGADINAKGEDALRLASENGHTEIVKLLIEGGADINAKGEDALRLASENGHTEIVKLLIEGGADINAKGEDALRLASENGHTEIVKLLIEGGADINENGGQALRAASKHRHGNVVKLLIKHGAHIDADVVAMLIENVVDRCALLAASEEGHEEVVKLVIDGGANINTGWPCPLYAASERGHAKVVKLLIECGADVDAGGPHRPLYAASQQGHEKVVKLLIERGADIGGEWPSPLYAASEGGHEKVVKLLIERGADIGGEWPSPLYAASEGGHEKVVKLLIERGADIGGEWPSPLCAASEGGHEKVVKLFIESGADINRGWPSPLYAASEGGHDKVVKLLIESGADINGEWPNPLYAASERGHVEIVKLLIESGADLNAGGNQHHALYAASSRGHVEIVKLFIESGADLNAGGKQHHALYAASSRGHLELVKLLIEGGADLNAGKKQYHSLYAASARGHTEIVKLLIQSGADLNAWHGTEVYSPLYAASLKRHEGVVKLLAEGAADIDVDGQYSPLYTACKQGHLKVVKLLIEGGADLNAQMLIDGSTDVNEREWHTWLPSPLYAASKGGHEKIVKLLLEGGAEINAGGDWSPLYAALKSHQEKIVRLLIEHGTDVNVKSRWGTALHQARCRGYHGIADLLAQHGAVDIGPEYRRRLEHFLHSNVWHTVRG